MAGLYPPYIEGTLPAFCINSAGNGIMTIPFSFNRAVSSSEVRGISAKFKTVQNDVLLFACEADSWSNDSAIFYVKENKINEVQESDIQIGQYYKVQLAFIDANGNIGYYSTVGVIKCTSEPEVSIRGLSRIKANNNVYEYVGLFEQPAGGDTTEKVYSSKFVIRNSSNQIYYETDELLHNTEEDTISYQAYESMYFNQDLDKNDVYTIQFVVTTNNDLVVYSPKYVLVQENTLESALNANIIAEMYPEDGYVLIRIAAINSAVTSNGTYVLSRASVSEPNKWEELKRFALKYELPTKEIFQDFTVEQGREYIYSIQQYNAYGVYSQREYSNVVYADFEDMFLYDGNRQLKLRFNPQVNTFRAQLSEAKQDTIGNKYPVFFRNPTINYKTFPIAGLISMLSDDNELFITKDEILRENFDIHQHRTPTADQSNSPKAYNSTTLNAKNHISERLFKLSVLDWINDGQIKLFRSPTEGNYLVRLMEASMSPENTLGRMIHNLSATAYEAADLTYSNLVKNKIIEDTTKLSINSVEANVTQFANVHFDTLTYKNGISENLLLYGGGSTYTTSIEILDTEMNASDASILSQVKFALVFAADGVYRPTDASNFEFVVGATGQYYINDVDPIYGIYILNPSEIPLTGVLNYQFDMPQIKDDFNSITNTNVDVGGYRQIVGPQISNLLYLYETTKDTVVRSPMMIFRKRPVQFLYTNDDKIATGTQVFTDTTSIVGKRELVEDVALYTDINLTNKFSDSASFSEFPYCIYIIRKVDSSGNLEPLKASTDNGENSYINEINNATNLLKDDAARTVAVYYSYLSDSYKANNPLYMFDSHSGEINSARYSANLIFNGRVISLLELPSYTLENIEVNEDNNIRIGNGLYGEIFYETSSITYMFEDDIPEKKEYDSLVETWTNTKNDATIDPIEAGDKMEELEIEITDAYKEYNKALATAIEEWTEKK